MNQSLERGSTIEGVILKAIVCSKACIVIPRDFLGFLSRWSDPDTKNWKFHFARAYNVSRPVLKKSGHFDNTHMTVNHSTNVKNPQTALTQSKVCREFCKQAGVLHKNIQFSLTDIIDNQNNHEMKRTHAM